MFDPKEKTYNINGQDVKGHFAIDYTGSQIDQNVSGEYWMNLYVLVGMYIVGSYINRYDRMQMS